MARFKPLFARLLLNYKSYEIEIKYIPNGMNQHINDNSCSVRCLNASVQKGHFQDLSAF